MAKQVVGLKIGASQLSAALIELNGSAKLLQIASGPIPRGIVSGGEVRDVPQLANELKAFFKQHGLPRRSVRVGVASNRIGVRAIEIAGIEDPDQLANAVRFRAQEALPIPVDQAVLDFQVLGETRENGEPPKTRVLLVVAYRDLVAGLAEACKLAGVRLVGIDLEAFALLRALTPPELEALGAAPPALVAVSIGAARSTMADSDGSPCAFARVIEWGGTLLTVELARALDVEYPEAERLKGLISLTGDEAPEGVPAERATLARETLRAGIQVFARELVSSLQFYQSQPDSLGIREVVLAGGTAQLGGIAETLESLVGVSVRVGDPLVAVGVPKNLKGGLPGPALAVPIGLGMGGI
ncbi:MAG: type IV pilus assembly protein PilM [Gaiellaceae bacterium]